MSFPKHAEYVDSGVEWLGAIPKHWHSAKVWMYFELGRGRVISNEEIQDFSGEYPVYSSQTKDNGVMGKLNTFDFEGDYITWTTDGANAGTVSRRSGKFNCTNVCGTMKPLQRTMWLDFYAYALSRATSWFVRHDINPKLMNNVVSSIPIPILPFKEQTQIARFLDHETAKIDALIAEQKRLIKLLQEKRQAVISHAVTKGLDPHVPMKDSGVEWLGEVPAHWEVRKLKYCASLVTTKGASRENVISLENIEGGTGRFISTVSEFSGEGVIFEPQDVLFGKLRPYLAKVHLARTSGIALGDILVFRATEEFEPEFLFFMLISQGFIDEVNQSSYGTKMPRANPEYILGLFVTAPPREEQLEIANYLVNAQYDKILPTILNANRLMKLLEERRSALISAAVTGKIDVRDWQPPANESAFDEDVRKAGLETST